MNYFSLDILAYVFLFIFSVYVFSKDDYIFLRKNLTMESLFNIAFLTMLVGLLFARLFYVLFHFKSAYFNPLVFLLFPYFPGLSLPGALASGSLFLVFYARHKKIPLGHIADIFLLSFLFVLPMGYALHFFVFQQNIQILSIILFSASVVLGIILLLIFKNLKLKEGTSALLVLLSSSTLFLLINFFNKEKNTFPIVPEDILIAGIFVISLLILLRLEHIISFKMKT